MALVSATEMIKKAHEGHYAIPAFNINNLEWTKSILAAAESTKSPVILEAKLVKDANFDVHIPQNWNYKYMRAAVTGVGTHTAGKISACMDVYPGV